MKVRESETSRRLYGVWNGIKQRCLNPKCKSYKNYGERGIRICEEWLIFDNFVDWALKSGYENHLTIERKNVNADYCPDNCCWITKREQSLNRTDTHWITIDGVTKTAAEWSDIYGISQQTISNRVRRYGWDDVRAVTTPVRPINRHPRLGIDFLRREYIDLGKRIIDISEQTGIPKSTIHKEIKMFGLHR